MSEYIEREETKRMVVEAVVCAAPDIAALLARTIDNLPAADVVSAEEFALLKAHKGDPDEGKALGGERKQNGVSETLGLPGGEGCGISADEVLRQENDRLKAEIKRLHEENFWLTGGLGRENDDDKQR